MREIKFRVWDGRQGKWGKFYWDEMPEWLQDANCCVEQFTGLKDKNGKESYHHDLFIHPGRNSGKPIEIKWHDGAWWGQYDKEDNFRLTKQEMSISEIIGTTHENPELL